MLKTRRILEEMGAGAAGLAGGAMSMAHSIRQELKDFIKARIEKRIKDMNIPTREELEVVKAMAEAARAENAALRKDIEKLQKKPAGKKKN